MATIRNWLTPRAVSGHRRTIVKTVLYRVLMLVVTVVIAFLFTDDVAASIKIGVGANLVKTVTYYLYERVWAHVAWGMDGEHG